MPLAAGESPDQEGIDGAEEDFAAFGSGAKARVAFQQVRDLGAGEIGIEQEAGPLTKQRLMAGRFQPFADRGADAALPDDGVGHWFSGGLFPEDGGFALVGNADSGDVRG